MSRRALLALYFGFYASFAAAGEQSDSLKVLFLGDRGHHRPADRAAQLIPVMAGRGIDIVYTENVENLNPTSLAQFDALLIYANIDAISPRQERALLDYVENGGGFVPIHCASYCFRDSAAYVALVGAQFLRHGTGEFDTRVVDASHPIMKGLEPFRTWDETYVHRLHNTNGRHVLQVRSEGSGEEPWTWVRSQGKGRVFYTAYGHDERTWGHPGFHDLIERGVRWASAKGEVFDSRPRPRTGLRSFEYEPATIPLYLPGRRWGTQGAPVKEMQKPVSPAESMQHLAVPRGFEVRLFAADPEIAKPICMAWDHRGRLWVAETTDYPNERQQPGRGRDRIKILDDTDGDGRADKFTTFAEGLSIPTSLAFANGGLVVHQAPDTLFLKDTDGDDKADLRRPLFTGWGTQDTHAGPSNLRWGLDNWLWGMVGYAGFRGTVGGEALQFRQGFFRFRPDGGKLEFLRNTNNNSWGVGFSEEGLVFGSTANGCPSVYLAIPNRYYESVRGWSSSALANIADSNRFFPATERVRQVDWHGGFTAGAGHALYTARAYPKHYWNSTAFINEPTGHLTATFTLHRQGSDFVAHNAWNLLASDDEWTAPIVAEVGPDGQVWVIDWYNFIVQHNPTPEGFKTGKGAAYETPLRDKTHGRIYRIVYRDSPPYVPLKLDPNDGPGLVTALKNDNQFWRMHAQRLLVERGRRDVVPELIKLVRDQSVDAIDLNPGATHALWTLHGLGAFDGTSPEANAAAVTALRHPSAGVRRNALQVLPRDVDATRAILAARVLSDPDAQVRLAGFLALADRPPSREAGFAVAEALVAGKADNDRWIGHAATSACASNALAFLEALGLEIEHTKASDQLVTIVQRVAEHFARGAPVETVAALIPTLRDANPRISDAMIAGLTRGWPKDRPARLNQADEAELARLVTRLSPDGRGRLVTLASRWGSKGLERFSAEIAAGLLATLRDEAKPDDARAAAALQLIDFRKQDSDAALAVLEQITPRTSPALASDLIAALGHSEASKVGPALVAAMPAMTPAVRTETLRTLMLRGEWAGALLDGVEQDRIALTALSLDQKQALAAHPDRSLAERAKRLIGRSGGLPDPDRQKVIERLTPELLAGGDVGRGKQVFKDQCAKCHTHSGEGGKVGPDLTGMAAHPKQELIVHILDPSRSVEGNFVQYSVVTNDGKVLNGLLASETKTAIELIDTEGKTHAVQRSDIEELVASKKSLMPEGFEKQLAPKALADLLEFLAQRGKYLPLDLRKEATIVSTQGMFYSKDSEVERLIFRDWSPKTYESIPFLLVDPRGERVPNVILLYSPNGQYPPKMPKSVSLPCHTAARAIHLLSGVSGWGAQSGNVPPSVSMIVRLHYDDGTTEDHPLQNGVHFADYIRPVEVPGSKLAFRLRGQQIRYLAISPKRGDPIDHIEFLKGPDATAPIVMAVTVELK